MGALPAYAAPAGGTTGDHDAAAINLRRPAAVRACGDLKPDPTASSKPQLCRLDPAQLSAAAQASIAPQQKKAAAATLAVQCALNALDTDRTTSCINTELAYDIFIPQTGEVIGTAAFQAVFVGVLDVRSREWNQRAEVTLLYAEAAAAPGFLGFATAIFPDGAGFTATESEYLEVTTVGVQVDFPYTVTSAGPATVQGHVEPDFVLTPLVPVESPPLQYYITPAPSVRCDSTPNVGPATGGCVYNEFTPTYNVSTTNPDTAQVAWHILWAQRNLINHWGWQGHGPALTRTRNQALITANRRVACGNRRPRPGLSCDEYPFASTQQGASLNPDYSWHMLNARQNSLEGSRYRRPWYIQNRMLENDDLWVNVVLPAGTTVTQIPGFPN
ncbi:hypothetical protein [Actinoplanes sp. NPDC026623]|uniref:NucA/NucB deoxyribonuclease domain-containing protein n=1 Tax=Actinoplanes sp. NPDC026623 TaxID=3155610 RepID=UPI0033E3135F